MLIHSQRVYLSLLKEDLAYLDSLRGSVPRSEFIKNIVLDYLSVEKYLEYSNND